MPFKLATGKKPSVSYLHVFFSCVLSKGTAHVDKKSLNICHQAQKSFYSIFFRIPQHKKGYLVYILSTREIISSYDGVFDRIFFQCVSI